ncbi:MAG: hypothetical protein G01um101420_779 [Parcubacteria group bacterium Gr01-1014_20]|nr:MAG: hypothetical protein G01um101420_779 [Parcubacteria group bacterium Gr01-1014_20]
MSVKIFTRAADGNDGFGALEADVATWEKSMADNFGVKFKTESRHVSTCAGINIEGSAFVNCTIAIFYTTG